MIKEEKNNNYNLYYWDDHWQKPVITEEITFRLFKDNNNLPCNYFAFPWAELCDNHLNNIIIKDLDNFKIKDSKCFTVIQHIHFRRLLPLIKKIGITHIFASHNTLSDIELEDKYQFKILPYSLYPVQSNNKEIINPITRKYFVSFIGQYEHYYLSKIRLNIFDIFSKYSDCCIIRRNKWHYWDMVYSDKKQTNFHNEIEYKYNLGNSKFSLCPSGSGTNSIRIWESMSYGTIPVILADTIKLPKIKDVNYEDFFIIWKEQDISKLHDYLKSLDDATIEKMSKKNIEIFNRYFSNKTMNNIIIDYFN